MIDQATTREPARIALSRDVFSRSTRREPARVEPALVDPALADRPGAVGAGQGDAAQAHAAQVHAAPGVPSSGKPRRQPQDCGQLPFLIKRDGTWLYRGSPIGRKELVCLFSSVLRRADDGHWYLQTPAERGRIEVEDTPWMAVELDWSGDGRDQRLSFRTNVDQVVTAGPEHRLRVAHDLLTCEPTPYLHISDGDGPFPIEARICRAVYYELVALAVPHWVGCRRMLGVWSNRVFFPLGELPASDTEAEETGC